MNKIKRQFSSGGIVFRKFTLSDSSTQIQWLVCASSPSELFPDIVWRLPKGWVDDAGEDIPGPMASGMVKADEKSLRQAAIREVMEEGGVEAEIIKKIGSEKYFFKHPVLGQILKFVTFYLMEWKRDLPEGFDEETSEIEWLSYDKAYKKLSFSGEKKVLKLAQGIIMG